MRVCTEVGGVTGSPSSGTSTRRRVCTVVGSSVAALLGGCAAPVDSGTETPAAETTVTVRIRNRDDVPRQYVVVVRRGESVTNEFSGVLPPGREQAVEMVATFRTSADQHQVTVSTEAGQTGRTWDPTECPAFVVDAYVENGRPGFDASCTASGE